MYSTSLARDADRGCLKNPVVAYGTWESDDNQPIFSKV